MVKVVVSIPGNFDNHIEEVKWIDGWPIPREGETVMTKNGDSLVVKHVIWYPNGEDDSEPFVYLVLWTLDAYLRSK